MQKWTADAKESDQYKTHDMYEYRPVKMSLYLGLWVFS
jgi:hypothetical protein